MRAVVDLRGRALGGRERGRSVVRPNLPLYEERTSDPGSVALEGDLRTPAGAQAMIERMAAHWWLPVVRGIFAILFGLVALAWPRETLIVLILIFGAFCFVDGVFAIVTAIRSATQHHRWGMLLLEGIIGILVGLLAYAAPFAIALFFIYFAAGWAIVTGIFELIAAFRIRQSVAGEIWMILAGVLSVILGLAFFVFPGIGLLAWIWLIGVYAIFFGALMIGFGLRLRAMHTAAGL
jgi:uncharacterized membrane protein HdeD (DUF308 family)